MAAPAVASVLVKVALTLSDEHTRKRIGWIIVGILSPILLMIVLIVSLLSATAAHNNNAVELCFHGGMITASVPLEYREYIEDMQSSFTLLDSVIEDLNGEMENESLDRTRVKAIFLPYISVRIVLPGKIINALQNALFGKKSVRELKKMRTEQHRRKL